MIRHSGHSAEHHDQTKCLHPLLSVLVKSYINIKWDTCNSRSRTTQTYVGQRTISGDMPTAHSCSLRGFPSMWCSLRPAGEGGDGAGGAAVREGQGGARGAAGPPHSDLSGASGTSLPHSDPKPCPDPHPYPRNLWNLGPMHPNPSVLKCAVERRCCDGSHSDRFLCYLSYS